MGSLGDGSSERVRTAAGAGARSWQGRVQQAAITAPQRLFDYRNVSGLALLRHRRPVLRVGSTVVVSRREDVLAVLADADAFPPPYAGGLAAGFVLGQSGRHLLRHRRALAGLLDASDLGGLQEQVADFARRAVGAADPDGMAVGRELVRPVLIEVVARFVGISGPQPEVLTAWTRAIFQDIFLNNAELPMVHQQGEQAVRELSALVRAAVEGRLAARPADRPDDLLTRMLALVRTPEQVDRRAVGLTEDEVVDTLIGLAIGWFWHGAKAVLVALDGLLERREALVPATAAARAGDLETLQRILWEVLRFRPGAGGAPTHLRQGGHAGAGHAVRDRGPARRVRPGRHPLGHVGRGGRARPGALRPHPGRRAVPRLRPRAAPLSRRGHHARSAARHPGAAAGGRRALPRPRSSRQAQLGRAQPRRPVGPVLSLAGQEDLPCTGFWRWTAVASAAS